MESPQSVLQANPACLILIVLGILLVDFIFKNCFVAKDVSANYITHKKRCDGETPLVRNGGLSHRAKLLASVKRRLDQQF
ncbi:hypothetical protein KR084_007654 [Drosophila pseudotakahashii]|nr:hypothetical protein KR084_007654 [Drosophila pseudotakahashii]